MLSSAITLRRQSLIRGSFGYYIKPNIILMDSHSANQRATAVVENGDRDSTARVMVDQFYNNLTTTQKLYLRVKITQQNIDQIAPAILLLPTELRIKIAEHLHINELAALWTDGHKSGHSNPIWDEKWGQIILNELSTKHLHSLPKGSVYNKLKISKSSTDDEFKTALELLPRLWRERAAWQLGVSTSNRSWIRPVDNDSYAPDRPLYCNGRVAYYKFGGVSVRDLTSGHERMIMMPGRVKPWTWSLSQDRLVAITARHIGASLQMLSWDLVDENSSEVSCRLPSLPRSPLAIQGPFVGFIAGNGQEVMLWSIIKNSLTSLTLVGHNKHDARLTACNIVMHPDFGSGESKLYIISARSQALDGGPAQERLLELVVQCYSRRDLQKQWNVPVRQKANVSLRTYDCIKSPPAAADVNGTFVIWVAAPEHLLDFDTTSPPSASAQYSHSHDIEAADNLECFPVTKFLTLNIHTHLVETVTHHLPNTARLCRQQYYLWNHCLFMAASCNQNKPISTGPYLAAIRPCYEADSSWFEIQYKGNSKDMWNQAVSRTYSPPRQGLAYTLHVSKEKQHVIRCLDDIEAVDDIYSGVFGDDRFLVLYTRNDITAWTFDEDVKLAWRVSDQQVPK